MITLLQLRKWLDEWAIKNGIFVISIEKARIKLGVKRYTIREPFEDLASFIASRAAEAAYKQGQIDGDRFAYEKCCISKQECDLVSDAKRIASAEGYKQGVEDERKSGIK